MGRTIRGDSKASLLLCTLLSDIGWLLCANQLLLGSGLASASQHQLGGAQKAIWPVGEGEQLPGQAASGQAGLGLRHSVKSSR